MSHPDFLNGADRSEPVNKACFLADECGSSLIRTAKTCRHFRTQRPFRSPPLRISPFISASHLQEGVHSQCVDYENNHFHFNAGTLADFTLDRGGGVSKTSFHLSDDRAPNVEVLRWCIPTSTQYCRRIDKLVPKVESTIPTRHAPVSNFQYPNNLAGRNVWRTGAVAKQGKTVEGE